MDKNADFVSLFPLYIDFFFSQIYIFLYPPLFFLFFSLFFYLILLTVFCFTNVDLMSGNEQNNRIFPLQEKTEKRVRKKKNMFV